MIPIDPFLAHKPLPLRRRPAGGEGWQLPAHLKQAYERARKAVELRQPYEASGWASGQAMWRGPSQSQPVAAWRTEQCHCAASQQPVCPKLLSPAQPIALHPPPP